MWPAMLHVLIFAVKAAQCGQRVPTDAGFGVVLTDGFVLLESSFDECRQF